MPTVRLGKPLDGFLTFGGEYKPGDMPPTGYLDWHEWAEVQHKAGLRQARCCQCSKVYFPQELSPTKVESIGYRRDGTEVRTMSPLCLKCEPAYLAFHAKGEVK